MSRPRFNWTPERVQALRELYPDNTAEVVAEQMAGSLGVMRAEVMPACHRAEQDLIETAARYQRTGRMGLTGKAIEHLRDVIRLHEEQRANAPRSVYEEALRLTGARIKNRHATVDLAATLGAPGNTEAQRAAAGGPTGAQS